MSLSSHFVAGPFNPGGLSVLQDSAVAQVVDPIQSRWSLKQPSWSFSCSTIPLSNRDCQTSQPPLVAISIKPEQGRIADDPHTSPPSRVDAKFANTEGVIRVEIVDDKQPSRETIGRHLNEFADVVPDGGHRKHDMCIDRHGRNILDGVCWQCEINTYEL